MFFGEVIMQTQAVADVSKILCYLQVQNQNTAY